jgi:hypothetical protein
VQNAVKRAVLAQQLAQLDSSQAADSFSDSIATANALGLLPNLFRRGAVGYRPVIQVIPDGPTLFTNAVISADRRYVRVSPSPQFFQMIEVNTFNFVTGQGGQQQQFGGGGAGGGGAGGGLF